MKIGTADDEEWEHVQDAVNVYCGLLPDPVTVVKGEYRLWHRKWQAVDIAERPQTVPSASFLSKCFVIASAASHDSSDNGRSRATFLQTRTNSDGNKKYNGRTKT